MYSEIGAQVVSGARMRAKAAKILGRRAIMLGVVVACSSASLVKRGFNSAGNVQDGVDVGVALVVLPDNCALLL